MIGLEFHILFAYSNKEAAQPSGYSTGLAIVTSLGSSLSAGFVFGSPTFSSSAKRVIACARLSDSIVGMY